ncbi:ANK REP REGION domain-containing protein [Citrus sinensis]|uniref:ANK REP REGION domain-containing protein n=1 Tax=Citrus sinensis TaxID=2711 RepID=A0ACB8I124_CITSI|nr:ANK REP REGION domain-containing protein [Citrus sinensis]
MEDIDNLFQNTMKGQWENVVKAYEDYPQIQKVKITTSEDTALHLAVVAELNDIVLRLVRSMRENPSDVLKLQNKKGNTALHLAAALGNEVMCHCMASKDPKLVAVLNHEGETPLFLAALEGQKDAFLCLHLLDTESKGDKNKNDSRAATFRKNNGDTILHAAIFGEHFSLAFQIIRYYPDLVSSVNENGLTPLHILASKPHVFESGSGLGWFESFVYKCVTVDELIKEEKHNHDSCSNNSRANNGLKFPQNFDKCINYFKLTKSISIRVLKGEGGDQVNPQHNSSTPQVRSINCLRSKDDQSKKDRKEDQPPDYVKCFLKGIIDLVLVDHRNPDQYKYVYNGQDPRISTFGQDVNAFTARETPLDPSTYKKKNARRSRRKETPILVAAKMGVTEMVKKILDTFPVAMWDLDPAEKNILLLAIENRRTSVYNLLLSRKALGQTIFWQVDNQGNSALHLAAKYGDHLPLLFPGAALQVQWEIKWFQHVKKLMPRHFFTRYNDDGKTPDEVFTESHRDLVKQGREWLTKTSESCSVVAALISTVAFATSAAVPGGVDQGSGKPILENEPVFNIFAISSLVALCSSVTALVLFLTILTSRYQENDFAKDLPRKLLLGLTTLFTSIVAILVSFCSGHSFILTNELRSAAYPIYAATCLPVTFFALAQLPLYFDLMLAILKTVPQRSYKVISD